MTTYEQFVFYKQFAESSFPYLKSKINKFINPILEVDYADNVNFTYASNRKPNLIILHIDNIVCECGNGFNKNKICSMIIIALTHELFHVEQKISQELYRSDYAYKTFIESAVENQTHKFLLENTYEIYSYLGVDMDLSYFEDIINRNGNLGSGIYQSIQDVESIYKHTIMNVIFRKDREYNIFEFNILNKYKTVYIGFENGPNFLIKSNGEFCGSNLNEFVSAVGCFAGKYDRYTVDVRMDNSYRDEENTAHVVITLSDRYLYPMVFRNHF